MGNENYIACECGYDIFVSPHLRGKTIECPMCGNEVDTNAPPPPVEEDADVTEPEEIVAPKEVLHFDDTSRDEWGAGSGSPFEDNEGPDPVYAPQSPRSESDEPEVVEPTYSADAFVDEDDEDLEEDVNAPDPSLIRTYQGAEHTNAYQDVDESEKCPNCGNPFRGDWDKQQVGDQVICYICSNQATEKVPDRILNKVTVNEKSDAEKSWAFSPNATIPEGPIEEKYWLFDPESDGFRKMVWTMALGLPIITLIVLNTEDFSPPRTSTNVDALQRQEAQGDVSEPGLPQWATVTYWLIVGIMGYVGQFSSFYAVLYVTDRLPHGEFKRDALVIGYTLLLLTGMSVVYFGIGSYLSEFPAGFIFMFLIGALLALIMIKMVIDSLDFRIRDFLYLALISGPVHAFLALPASLIYAALAAIAL